MEVSPQKNKVRERLFRLKQTFHATGDMESIIGDLEWFLEARKDKEPDEAHANLWSVMQREYSEFSDEELAELTSQLKAD